MKLNSAASAHRMPASICLDRIAGSASFLLIWADTELGRYDELQRKHRLLQTCLLSGYGIKDFHYDTPPTAVDFAARAIVTLAKQSPKGRGIFHIAATDQMQEGVFERCNAIAGTSLTLLPRYQWTESIRQLHDGGQSLPIVPLIEQSFGLSEQAFYERERHESGKARFDCSLSQSMLRNVGIVAPVLNDDLLRMCLQRLRIMKA